MTLRELDIVAKYESHLRVIIGYYNNENLLKDYHGQFVVREACAALNIPYEINANGFFVCDLNSWKSPIGN